jgi:hypothetical protein
MKKKNSLSLSLRWRKSFQVVFCCGQLLIDFDYQTDVLRRKTKKVLKDIEINHSGTTGRICFFSNSKTQERNLCLKKYHFNEILLCNKNP